MMGEGFRVFAAGESGCNDAFDEWRAAGQQPRDMVRERCFTGHCTGKSCILVRTI